MIRIEIAPDIGTGYVLRVKDGENGRILLSSSGHVERFIPWDQFGDAGCGEVS